MRSRHAHPRGGFTLTEALIASAIVAVTVVALVTPFSLAARHQRLDALRTTGLALASQMTERLLTLDYTEVLAVDGLSEAGAAITDAAGQPMNDPALNGFTRRVRADEIPLPLPGEADADAAVFCRVTVAVEHADLPPLTVTRLFAKP